MAQKIQYMSDVPPHGNIVRFIGEVEGGPEGRAIFISVISIVVAQRCYVHDGCTMTIIDNITIFCNDVNKYFHGITGNKYCTLRVIKK